ncbi:hypothetical protein STEG23_010642, partial [Scotinomys teguina]
AIFPPALSFHQFLRVSCIQTSPLHPNQSSASKPVLCIQTSPLHPNQSSASKPVLCIL